MRDIPKMVEMTKQIVNSTKLPVTVKTRLGWDENTKYIVEVAERLQDVGIKAIYLYMGELENKCIKECDWTLIKSGKR